MTNPDVFETQTLRAAMTAWATLKDPGRARVLTWVASDTLRKAYPTLEAIEDMGGDISDFLYALSLMLNGALNDVDSQSPLTKRNLEMRAAIDKRFAEAGADRAKAKGAQS